MTSQQTEITRRVDKQQIGVVIVERTTGCAYIRRFQVGAAENLPRVFVEIGHTVDGKGRQVGSLGVTQLWEFLQNEEFKLATIDGLDIDDGNVGIDSIQAQFIHHRAPKRVLS
jgi:hypothetical protein